LRLDVCVLLAVTLDGPVPVTLLDEVLSILATLHGLDPEVTSGWCTLPPYAIQAALHHVREAAQVEQQQPQQQQGSAAGGAGGYGTIELALLDAVGGLLRGVSGFDPDSHREQHDKWASLLARHAVLLLSHTPSCPPIASRPVSVAAQRAYDTMLPLLRRAGMAHTDLYGDEGKGKGKGKGTNKREGQAAGAARWRYASMNTRVPLWSSGG
jgi:hypothetical protein